MYTHIHKYTYLFLPLSYILCRPIKDTDIDVYIIHRHIYMHIYVCMYMKQCIDRAFLCKFILFSLYSCPVNPPVNKPRPKTF